MILKWEPKPDITTYELALCLDVFANAAAASHGNIAAAYEKLPSEAQRHWEVLDARRHGLPGTEKDVA